MAELLYQGHGSYRITTDEQMVVYIDPYAGDGYDVAADIILVTHQHYDHNCISLVKQKGSCIVITEKEAVSKGRYQTFSVEGLEIEAVEAYNTKHLKEECVGYVLRFNNISIYASGDTSLTDDMKNKLPSYHLDYALLPIDGVYNMTAKEAGECAKYIGAKHTIPIHMKPGELFDIEVAEKFSAQGRIILLPGQSIKL